MTVQRAHSQVDLPFPVSEQTPRLWHQAWSGRWQWRSPGTSSHWSEDVVQRAGGPSQVHGAVPDPRGDTVQPERFGVVNLQHDIRHFNNLQV